MVTSVNGDRGSSVIPIGGDDYMFLGRGKHVVVDNSDVHMSGSSGATLIEGINMSGAAKRASISGTSASMKIVQFFLVEASGSYLMKIGGYDINQNGG